MSKEKKSIMAILFTAVMFLGIFFLMPTDNKAQAGSIGVTVNVTDGNGTAAVSNDSPNRGEKVIVTATPVVTSGAVYFPVISVKDSDSTRVS